MENNKKEIFKGLFNAWRTVIFALLAVGFSLAAAEIKHQARSDAWAERKASMDAYLKAKRNVAEIQDGDRYSSIVMAEKISEPNVEMHGLVFRILGIVAFAALSIDMLLNQNARSWLTVTIWILWVFANMFSGLAD